MMTTKQFKFSPQWVTGFTQADGSFMVVFTQQSNARIPYRPRPVFVLAQTKREADIILSLKDYMGVGYIRKDKDSIYLVVDSRKDLLNYVIPHFDRYPVVGGKYRAYQIFREVVIAINNKAHLNPSGFIEILESSYFINQTSQRTDITKKCIVDSISLKFGKIVVHEQEPKVYVSNNFFIDIDFLNGLIDGDGSFGVSFGIERKNITPFFTVSGDIVDYDILCIIYDFFKTGQVTKSKIKKYAQYTVHDRQHLVEKIAPHLEKMHFNTIKSTVIRSVIQGWKLLYEDGIGSKDNFTKLVELLYNINIEGRYRKLTKENYIKHFYKL